MQCYQWLEDAKRIAFGIYHYAAPRVHPGQWVRFIGDPHEVKRCSRGLPRIGTYGQVWWRERKSGNKVVVSFLGSEGLCRLSVFDLEPLVGPPVGRPLDHLRMIKRMVKGNMARRTQGAQ
jgi:hypothetical protein